MIDFEKVIEYSLGGFGAGAVSFAILSETGAIVSDPMYTLLGEAIFGAVTVLGVVGGILSGRKSASASSVPKA